MTDSTSITLDNHVWRNVLETLEAATPVSQTDMTKKERLAWYERSHAITQIKNAIPKRRRQAESTSNAVEQSTLEAA